MNAEDEKVPDKAEVGGFSELVKNLLKLKDTSELMVDLSYSALLYDSEDIAHEIAYLEDFADALEKEVVLTTLNEVVRSEDAGTGYIMIRLAQAMEMIADAANSMADVVLRDIEKNPVIGLSLRDSRTTITSVVVGPSSPLRNKSLGEVRLASESGMWVIAVRRGKTYIYGPDEDTVIDAGDTLIARGPREGVPVLFRLCGSELKDEDRDED